MRRRHGIPLNNCLLVFCNTEVQVEEAARLKKVVEKDRLFDQIYAF